MLDLYFLFLLESIYLQRNIVYLLLKKNHLLLFLDFLLLKIRYEVELVLLVKTFL